MGRKFLELIVAGVLVAAPAVGAEDVALPPSTFFDEAKITVNERARADGYLRVRIMPENGASREATIAVTKRMRENEIAKALAEALGAVVGSDYEVDRDAGEHVKIRRANRDVANFALEIAFSAPGFAIILDN
jgi:hypothetical protein